MPDMTNWDRIRRIAGPKGTYLFCSLRSLDAYGSVGDLWLKNFRQQAEENGMIVRVERGHIYLDMKD